MQRMNLQQRWIEILTIYMCTLRSLAPIPSPLPPDERRLDSAAETPLNNGESRDESQDEWRFKNEISLIAILAS